MTESTQCADRAQRVKRISRGQVLRFPVGYPTHCLTRFSVDRFAVTDHGNLVSCGLSATDRSDLQRPRFSALLTEIVGYGVVSCQSVFVLIPATACACSWALADCCRCGDVREPIERAHDRGVEGATAQIARCESSRCRHATGPTQLLREFSHAGRRKRRIQFAEMKGLL